MKKKENRDIQNSNYSDSKKVVFEKFMLSRQFGLIIKEEIKKNKEDASK